MPFWFAPYHERHPAPKDIQDVYKQLHEALVEPYGQIPEDDNFRWVHDREDRLKRSEKKEEAQDLLYALWVGFLERLRTKYPNADLKIVKNHLVHRESPYVVTHLIDFVAALRHFIVPGRLPYTARQAFFDGNPRSLICNPVEYEARRQAQQQQQAQQLQQLQQQQQSPPTDGDEMKQ